MRAKFDELTDKQKEALRLIKMWHWHTGRSPTLREIAGEMGLSKTAALAHVIALEKKGYLYRKDGRRGIKLL